MPTVPVRCSENASFSFVPTPSVPETSTGCLYFFGISQRAPKPPIPARTSGRIVFLANGLMASHSASPDLISTPAAREERPSAMPKFYVMQQLPLGISAAAQPSFDNFVAGRNAEALARVRDLAEGTLTERIVSLWGDAGSGRTHLLRAAARTNASLVVVDDVHLLDTAAQHAL